jgi:hypothetical protein
MRNVNDRYPAQPAHENGDKQRFMGMRIENVDCLPLHDLKEF